MDERELPSIARPTEIYEADETGTLFPALIGYQVYALKWLDERRDLASFANFVGQHIVDRRQSELLQDTLSPTLFAGDEREVRFARLNEAQRLDSETYERFWTQWIPQFVREENAIFFCYATGSRFWLQPPDQRVGPGTPCVLMLCARGGGDGGLSLSLVFRPKPEDNGKIWLEPASFDEFACVEVDAFGRTESTVSFDQFKQWFAAVCTQLRAPPPQPPS